MGGKFGVSSIFQGKKRLKKSCFKSKLSVSIFFSKENEKRKRKKKTSLGTKAASSAAFHSLAVLSEGAMRGGCTEIPQSAFRDPGSARIRVC